MPTATTIPGQSAQAVPISAVAPRAGRAYPAGPGVPRLARLHDARPVPLRNSFLPLPHVPTAATSSAPIRATGVKRAYEPDPVTTRAAGAGLTVLLDPSSQLPGSSRRAARGQAGAPAAAQRRGRTSLTPASGGRSSRAREGRLRLGLSGVACVVPVRGWRSGLASTHPAPPKRAGGCHDHVSGTGLLSQMIERGAGAGSCRKSERARGLVTLPSFTAAGGVLASTACIWLSRCQARVSSLRAIAMVAIFLPRRLAMAAWVAANSGDRLAVWAAGLSTQRSQAEPCLEMCPCRTVRSEPRTVGVSPAQLASLRALPNRVMSPISASITSAVNWPTPG